MSEVDKEIEELERLIAADLLDPLVGTVQLAVLQASRARDRAERTASVVRGQGLVLWLVLMAVTFDVILAMSFRIWP